MFGIIASAVRAFENLMVRLKIQLRLFCLKCLSLIEAISLWAELISCPPVKSRWRWCRPVRSWSSVSSPGERLWSPPQFSVGPPFHACLSLSGRDTDITETWVFTDKLQSDRKAFNVIWKCSSSCLPSRSKVSSLSRCFRPISGIVWLIPARGVETAREEMHATSHCHCQHQIYSSVPFRRQEAWDGETRARQSRAGRQEKENECCNYSSGREEESARPFFPSFFLLAREAAESFGSWFREQQKLHRQERRRWAAGGTSGLFFWRERRSLGTHREECLLAGRKKKLILKHFQLQPLSETQENIWVCTFPSYVNPQNWSVAHQILDLFWFWLFFLISGTIHHKNSSVKKFCRFSRCSSATIAILLDGHVWAWTLDDKVKSTNLAVSCKLIRCWFNGGRF